MTQALAPARMQPYTRRRIHGLAREIHTPRVIWRNPGWICIACALILSFMGIVAIATTEPSLAVRQLVFLAVGWFAAAIVAAPHFRHFQRLSYPLLLIVVGLLLFVLIPFVPDFIVHPRNGSRRWINLVVTDFQPSELAKVIYVLALANYLRSRSSYRTLRGLLLPLVLTFIPMGLILVEPDLGTSLLFLPTLFAMLIAAGAKLKHLLPAVVLGLALAPAMYPLLQSHQKDRIDALLAQIRGDTRYEDDIGYQAARAMTLVGSGRFIGAGREHASALVVHNHLPEEHNDMIFAVIGCRWGFLGAMLIWMSFLLLALGGLIVAGLSRDPFGRLVAVGLVAIIFAQMLINTGMTIGLLPITGITLPFMSYGGSSMVCKWIMMGLLLNIAMRRRPYLARQSFEFDDNHRLD